MFLNTETEERLKIIVFREYRHINVSRNYFLLGVVTNYFSPFCKDELFCCILLFSTVISLFPSFLRKGLEEQTLSVLAVYTIRWRSCQLLVWFLCGQFLRDVAKYSFIHVLISSFGGQVGREWKISSYSGHIHQKCCRLDDSNYKISYAL